MAFSFVKDGDTEGGSFDWAFEDWMAWHGRLGMMMRFL
jgi:hypothetical protein